MFLSLATESVVKIVWNTCCYILFTRACLSPDFALVDLSFDELLLTGAGLEEGFRLKVTPPLFALISLSKASDLSRSIFASKARESTFYRLDSAPLTSSSRYTCVM